MNWFEKLIDAIKTWLEKQNATPVDPTPTPEPEPTPEPTPTPEPEPTPAPVDGTLLPSQVKWLGPSYAKAKQTVTIVSASMAGKHLNFKTQNLVPWPKTGEKGASAVGFVIRKINGQPTGGKIEWVIVARGWYDIATNIGGGYNGHTMPKKGETVWCGLGHPLSTSECSNLLPIVWQI